MIEIHRDLTIRWKTGSESTLSIPLGTLSFVNWSRFKAKVVQMLSCCLERQSADERMPYLDKYPFVDRVAVIALLRYQARAIATMDQVSSVGNALAATLSYSRDRLAVRAGSPIRRSLGVDLVRHLVEPTSLFRCMTVRQDPQDIARPGVERSPSIPRSDRRYGRSGPSQYMAGRSQRCFPDTTSGISRSRSDCRGTLGVEKRSAHIKECVGRFYRQVSHIVDYTAVEREMGGGWGCEDGGG